MQNAFRKFVLVTGMRLVMLSGPFTPTLTENIELPDGSKIQLPVSCPVCEMKIEAKHRCSWGASFCQWKGSRF